MRAMITTEDNPYNPFTHYDEWNLYDMDQGYHTSAYLARIVRTSDELTDAEANYAIENAIDEIIEMHAGGIYKKVLESS